MRIQTIITPRIGLGLGPAPRTTQCWLSSENRDRYDADKQNNDSININSVILAGSSDSRDLTPSQFCSLVLRAETRNLAGLWVMTIRKPTTALFPSQHFFRYFGTLCRFFWIFGNFDPP